MNKDPKYDAFKKNTLNIKHIIPVPFSDSQDQVNLLLEDLLKMSMAAHVCTPETGRMRQKDQESKLSLGYIHSKISNKQQQTLSTGKMFPWLRAVAAFIGDLRFESQYTNSSSHQCVTLVPRDLTSVGTRNTCCAHTYMQARCSYI